MVHEDCVVAAIAEQRAAELSDLGRCLYPAGRRRIELTKRLEALIFLHGEERRAHAVAISTALVFGLCSFRASSASRS